MGYHLLYQSQGYGEQCMSATKGTAIVRMPCLKRNIALCSFYAFGGALAGSWFGCVTAPGPSQESASNDKGPNSQTMLSEQEQKRLSEYAAEVDVGRSMAGRMLQQFRPVDDADLARYITTVGNVVAAGSPFRERTFVFGVLDSDQINAFAMPGGYIFVTRGTLLAAQSEAELAGILGHEIAHVGKRHIFDAMLQRASSGDKDSAKSRAEVPAIDARKRPAGSSSTTAATIAAVIGGGAGGTFNVLAAVQGGLGILLEDGLDPSLENEADTEGVQYAMAAGYEPRALKSYFERVFKKGSPDKTAVLSKTHPSITLRIQNVDRLIKNSVPTDYRGALGEERFRAAVRSLAMAQPKSN
jgi:predicted Zn-dependent protease